MDDTDSDTEDGSGSLSPALSRYTERAPVAVGHRILYIQMVSEHRSVCFNSN